MPASGKAAVTVSETTAGGTKSPDKVIEVTVKAFCALDINNFIGAFDCDEAGYGVYPVNFTKHPTLANTIVNDNFWDFAGSRAGDILHLLRRLPGENYGSKTELYIRRRYYWLGTGKRQI